MKRRIFIQKILAYGASLSLLGLAGCETSPQAASSNSPKDDTEDPDQALKDEDLVCQETTPDIEGPFHRDEAPHRMNLRVGEPEAEDLILRGQVYGSDCVTPLSQVHVEIWHADTQGAYDNTSEEYQYRGVVKTSESGEYEFQSIIPGRYLNGADYRPSHIHMKVIAEGYPELTTQLYFAGDPYIDKDPWASQPSAEDRIITLSESEASFNVYL